MLTPWAEHKKKTASVEKLRRFLYGKSDKYKKATMSIIHGMTWAYALPESYVIGEKTEVVDSVEHLYYLLLEHGSTVRWIPAENIVESLSLTFEECLLSSDDRLRRWVRQFANDTVSEKT